jgi:histidine triad (HIT) family protein
MAQPDPNCLFCKIVSGEIPARVVARDERTLTFMDINPATRGHALVIPLEHAPDVHSVDPGLLGDVHRSAQRAAGAAKQALGADGVNILQSNGPAAWQTVFHLHVHVIPRYAGDPLRLPWVPGPGDQAEIEAAATELKAAL